MANGKQELERILMQWQQQIIAPHQQELAQRLTDLELSSLYACIPDCFEEFYKIYYYLIPALLHARQGDVETLADHLHDLGGLAGSLERVKNLIVASRNGFDVLLRVLDEKAEGKH